jgi:hypothetical protein
MYITYEEYKNFGGELSDTAFNKFSYQAEQKIKTETYNRIGVASEAVKRCMVRLIDIFNSADVTAGDKVSSFSHDGLSQSFVTHSSTDYAKEIDEVIKMYLSCEYAEDGTPLLYRGIDEI